MCTELREKQFSLDELLAEEWLTLEPLAAAKPLRLSMEPGAENRVRTDRVKLARVLRNLINNAIKFTEEGSITLSCRVDDARQFVELRVADTGTASHRSPFAFPARASLFQFRATVVNEGESALPAKRALPLSAGSLASAWLMRAASGGLIRGGAAREGAQFQTLGLKNYDPDPEFWA